jgi:hypothetical protein
MKDNNRKKQHEKEGMSINSSSKQKQQQAYHKDMQERQSDN